MLFYKWGNKYDLGSHKGWHHEVDKALRCFVLEDEILFEVEAVVWPSQKK